MKLLILTVGKPKDRAMDSLHEEYAGRIVKLGVPYRTRAIREVPAGGRFSEDHAMEREAGALVEALPDRGTIIALDRTGKEYGSVELSGKLARWAAHEATFVIGGPLGLHGSFLDRSDSVWSLSPLTFPHELARVLLAEQLYRALAIMRGIPYHK